MGKALPKPKVLKSPSWRLEMSLKESCTEELEDSYLQEACNLVGGEVVSTSVQEAYLLYYLPQSRTIMNSLMISDATLSDLAISVGASEEVLVAYSKIFFDKSVFPNRLVLKEFIDMLPEHTSIEVNYKALMRASFSLGYEYILWKMSLDLNTSANPNLDKLAYGILKDGYWRSREHKGFSIQDSRCKESRSWIPSVLKTMEMTKNLSPSGDSDIETLRLKLVKADTTVSIEDFSDEIKG